MDIEEIQSDRAVDLLTQNKQLHIDAEQLEIRLKESRKLSSGHKDRELANAKKCSEYYEQIKQLQTKIEQQQDCIRKLIKTLQIENQCVKCRYGDKSEERCTDDADGELPCVGFDEAFDGSVFLEQAIAKAKEIIE